VKKRKKDPRGDEETQGKVQCEMGISRKKRGASRGSAMVIRQEGKREKTKIEERCNGGEKGV